MSYHPIHVEALVRRATYGSRATDPQIPPREPRRHLSLPRLRRPRPALLRRDRDRPAADARA